VQSRRRHLCHWPGEPFTGRAVCDDIETLWPGEVTRNLGALTPEAMSRVEDGLRAALDL
jgi:mRNA-degrading endonuclease toxin of MazEF toxin-antitoxin module